MRKRLLTILVAMCLLVGIGQAVLAQAPVEYVAIQWQWAQLTETEPASQSVIVDPENYVLVLNADGSASIKADCNILAWTYTMDGAKITFNTLGPSTLALCPETSSDQIFLEKLGKGGALSLDNGRLVLALSENAGTMVFDNGGAVVEAPAELPDTGGAAAMAPWAISVLAGLATLGAGVALRRRK